MAGKDLTPYQVSQQGASAHGDVVGRDKVILQLAAPPPGIVQQLIEKLQQEIEKDEKVRHTVENLAHFHTRHAHDGIDGLEAKLKAGSRSSEYFDALAKKELFVKLLEKWSFYASAQEIFAYLLAKAEYEFTYFVHPQIATLGQIEVNQIISERIVDPTINQCGSTVFTLNHSVAMGMVYWLAEQCFIRWHQ